MKFSWMNCRTLFYSIVALQRTSFGVSWTRRTSSFRLNYLKISITCMMILSLFDSLMPECDISRIRAKERKNHLQTIVSVKRTRARKKKKGATAGLSKK